jgi:large conductance mechanosensitive channel
LSPAQQARNGDESSLSAAARILGGSAVTRKIHLTPVQVKLKWEEPGMFKEFKEFAMKGNVLDMAVGIIMGVAFGKIITSFVSDVIMPPIGRLLGNVDFSGLFINVSGQSFKTIAEAKAAGAATINYGLFLNTVLDFLIVAFVMFMMVRQVNRLKRPAPAPALPATKECSYCFSTVPFKATRCPHCTSELKIS